MALPRWETFTILICSPRDGSCFSRLSFTDTLIKNDSDTSLFSELSVNHPLNMRRTYPGRSVLSRAFSIMCSPFSLVTSGSALPRLAVDTKCTLRWYTRGFIAGFLFPGSATKGVFRGYNVSHKNTSNNKNSTILISRLYLNVPLRTDSDTSQVSDRFHLTKSQE